MESLKARFWKRIHDYSLAKLLEARREYVGCELTCSHCSHTSTQQLSTSKTIELVNKSGNYAGRYLYFCGNCGTYTKWDAALAPVPILLSKSVEGTFPLFLFHKLPATLTESSYDVELMSISLGKS